MSTVSCDILGYWRPSTFERRDTQSVCHSRPSWPGTGVSWLGIPQPWMICSLRAPCPALVFVTVIPLSQVRAPGWEQAPQPGAERRLCSSAGSRAGEPLGSLSDWSDKGEAYRESHLDCTAPHTRSQAGKALRGAQPLPREGGPCTPSPLTFASCLKYHGGIFSTSD